MPCVEHDLKNFGTIEKIAAKFWDKLVKTQKKRSFNWM
jgi:hypothetical protein